MNQDLSVSSKQSYIYISSRYIVTPSSHWNEKITVIHRSCHHSSIGLDTHDQHLNGSIGTQTSYYQPKRSHSTSIPSFSKKTHVIQFYNTQTHLSRLLPTQRQTKTWLHAVRKQDRRLNAFSNSKEIYHTRTMS